MTTTQKFLNQLEQESATTLKMLSVVPEEKFGWQPHPKSMSLGRLATHVAELPGWITIALDTEGLNLANNPFEAPEIHTKKELMDFFEQKLNQGRTSLQNATDEDLTPIWILSYGDKVVSNRPKEDVIVMAISQIIHHRAQLGVFLRLLNVPIPGSYGPSADEMGM